MKMEPIVSSETSTIRTQTPGNYSKRNKLHLEHGESLKKIRRILSIEGKISCPLVRHKCVWGSRGIAAIILNLCTRWVWEVGQLYASATLPSWGKSNQYTLIRILAEQRSESRRSGVEKNLLPLLGIAPGYLGCTTPQLFTIPTEQSWLLNISRSILHFTFRFRVMSFKCVI